MKKTENLPAFETHWDANPFVTILSVGFYQKAFLSLTPWVFPNVRVKFIVPSKSLLRYLKNIPFPALLSISLLAQTLTIQLVCDELPLLSAKFMHRLLNKLVFLKDNYEMITHSFAPSKAIFYLVKIWLWTFVRTKFLNLIRSCLVILLAGVD
jgi:hypothetical protein